MFRHELRERAILRFRSHTKHFVSVLDSILEKVSYFADEGIIEAGEALNKLEEAFSRIDKSKCDGCGDYFDKLDNNLCAECNNNLSESEFDEYFDKYKFSNYRG